MHRKEWSGGVGDGVGDLCRSSTDRLVAFLFFEPMVLSEAVEVGDVRHDTVVVDA
jgi:hypothetical protein